MEQKKGGKEFFKKTLVGFELETLVLNFHGHGYNIALTNPH